MNQDAGEKSWSSGASIGIGVAVGSSLGALVAVVTGHWRLMPLTLSACIALGALAAGITGRSDS